MPMYHALFFSSPKARGIRRPRRFGRARFWVSAFEVGFARGQAGQSVGAGMDGLSDEITGIGGGGRDQCDAI